MSMSLTKLMAGTSSKYYTLTASEVVTDHGGGMADYYNTPGTPPGQWMGAGLPAIDRKAGTFANKTDISRVYDNLVHPDTERSLSRNSIQQIEAGEVVGGYDLTFTLPKSVNILWASGDEHVRRTIMKCHKEAVQESIDWFEKNEAYSRTGEGGVAKKSVKGIIATDFTHWDSRDGDPHLHDHVLVSNIVLRPDGKTGALDGRAVYKAAVAISERHANLFMDKLTDSLGVQWRQRQTPGTKSAVYDLVGIDDDLIDSFSSRNLEIEDRYRRLVKKMEDAGITPNDDQLRKAHRQAWRESRKAKPKTPKTLHQLMEEWDGELGRLGYDGADIVNNVVERGGLNMDIQTLLDREDPGRSATPRTHGGADGQAPEKPLPWLTDLLSDTIQDTGKLETNWKRSAKQPGPADPLEKLHEDAAYNTTVISESSIRAAAERLTRGIRLKPGQRDRLVDLLVDEEKTNLILLTPGRFNLTERQKADPDLTIKRTRAVTDFPEGKVYATKELVAAETRFKELAETTTFAPAGFGTSETTYASMAERIKATQKAQGDPHPLAPDQEKAVIGLYMSRHPIICLAGPAGTGKTTTLKCLADITKQANGNPKVIALAPTAVAAQELGASLGVPADTMAKMLYEDDTGNLDRRIDSTSEDYASTRLFLDGDRFDFRLDHVMNRYRKRMDLRQQLASLEAQKANLTVPDNGTVIIDEAGMANTFDLQRLAEICASKHAKMILVGDDKQLNTVGGGAGALTWLVRHVDPATVGVKGEKPKPDLSFTLDSIWRFDDPQEAERSKDLREHEQDKTTGDYTVLHEYQEAGRIHHGTGDALEEGLVKQVAADFDSGIDSLLIVGSNEGIAELNQRISEKRQAGGTVEHDPRRRTVLADGSTTGRGDVICTRSNDRRIRTNGGHYIRNNDLWIVDEAGGRGIRCHSPSDKNETVLLPDSYVEKNVIGGYAITPHRSQGKTVARGYYYIPLGQSELSSANTLYVAMTRGRSRNDVYVATKDVKEMMTGVKDSYELAAWRQRNKARFEKVEHRKPWDEANGPAPSGAWYTQTDLLPTSEEQAMWTLHQVLGHDQTGRFATQWAQDYENDMFRLRRLSGEWKYYQRTLSERQLARTLDPSVLGRLKDDREYGQMLEAYGDARHALGEGPAGRIVAKSLQGTSKDIRDQLRLMAGGKTGTSQPGGHYMIDLSTLDDKGDRDVADMMNQTLEMADMAEEGVGETDWSRYLTEKDTRWRDTVGPVPPPSSPLRSEYEKVVKEITTYRIINRITDQERPFGPGDHADKWQEQIASDLSRLQVSLRDENRLAAVRQEPNPIPAGKQKSIRAGKHVLLDFTGSATASGDEQVAVQVSEATVNAAIGATRRLTPDKGPLHVTVAADESTDLTPVWNGLTPRERGETQVAGSDGSLQPLWKHMTDRASSPADADRILDGLDIDARRLAKNQLASEGPGDLLHGERGASPSNGPSPSITPVSGSTPVTGPDAGLSMS